MSDRAYLLFNDQWKHVYILGRFKQTNILGNSVEMARVKLVKNSSVTIDVEADRLEEEKPRKQREFVQ